MRLTKAHIGKRVVSEGHDGSWWNVLLALDGASGWVKDQNGKYHTIENDDDWLFWNDYIDEEIERLEKEIETLRESKSK